MYMYMYMYMYIDHNTKQDNSCAIIPGYLSNHITSLHVPCTLSLASTLNLSSSVADRWVVSEGEGGRGWWGVVCDVTGGACGNRLSRSERGVARDIGSTPV